MNKNTYFGASLPYLYQPLLLSWVYLL